MPTFYHICGTKIAYSAAKPVRCPGCGESLEEPFPVSEATQSSPAPKRRWSISVDDLDPEGTDTGVELEQIRPAFGAERAGAPLTVKQLREEGGGGSDIGRSPLSGTQEEARSKAHAEYLAPLLNAAQAANQAQLRKPSRKRNRRAKSE